MNHKNAVGEKRRQCIANNLRILREREGITTTELAKKIGCTINTVFNWENLKTITSIESLWRLADYFGVTINQICGREPLPEKAPPKP